MLFVNFGDVEISYIVIYTVPVSTDPTSAKTSILFIVLCKNE